MVLIGVCPTCSEVRYRSRDIAEGEQPKATDFAPVGDAPAPETDAAIPLCHACGAALKFGKDNITAIRRPGTPSAVRPGPFETLFEVRGDEVIKDIQTLNGIAVVLTNKRIIKVDLREVLNG